MPLKIHNHHTMLLGGFFMALYRIILTKIPSIALNVRSQRRITNELIVLEWVTLGMIS